MPSDRKTGQLQIRVSPAQKRAIRRRAKQAGMSISEWVLEQVDPPGQRRFQELMQALEGASKASFVLAELNDFLSKLGRAELIDAVKEPPQVSLEPVLANQVAAMIELAAASKSAPLPAWTARIAPLDTPWFATDLKSLRLHLLTQAPPPFRRRNIFVDASLGDRV